jgi:hypothetical protein
MNGGKVLYLDFKKYKITDKSKKEEIIKLIKSLIKLEHSLYN